jgi:hypothetical protein
VLWSRSPRRKLHHSIIIHILESEPEIGETGAASFFLVRGDGATSIYSMIHIIVGGKKTNTEESNNKKVYKLPDAFMHSLLKRVWTIFQNLRMLFRILPIMHFYQHFTTRNFLRKNSAYNLFMNLLSLHTVHLFLRTEIFFKCVTFVSL